MNSFTKKYLELQEENKKPSLAPSIKKASVTTKNTSSSQTKWEEEEQQESKNSFTSRYLELSKKREAGEPADYTRLNHRREETPSYLDTARNATEKNIQVTTSGSLEEMQTRLNELEARQRELTSYMSGAMRGGINAPQTQKFQEEMSTNDKEIKRLKTEISAAQSGGMVSELDQMKTRLNELKAQEAQARNKAVQYTGSYAGRAAAAANPEAANAIFNEISSISSEREALEKEIERIEYVNKYQDKTYEDKFTGQFGASYTLGRLNQDRALAWNAYLTNPTDANRQKAEAADKLIARFQENNAETLDDDATLPWISQSLANYLPQFIDQAKYSAAGAAIGGATGSVVPGIGTGFGIKAGVVAGSGAYSFETMRGIAFGDLLAMGVDEETARAAANDEAIISSLIEMADTGVDIASLGVGKLINAITKGGAKAIAGGAAESAGKKLLKALAGYGLNIGGEMMEEGTQQAVTIANQNRVQNGETGGSLSLAGDAARVFKNAVTGENTEDREEIWEAAKEGGKIAAMIGGASAISNNLATAAVENYYGKKMSGYGGETVQAIIEEGLASDEKSESYRQAKVLQQKMENGEEITGREIGRLYEQNVRTINDEEAQAKKSQAAATISKPELTSFEKKLQAATGYGEYGARAFSELMDSENMSIHELRPKFQTAYEAGMTNLPQTAVTLTTNIQKRAFNAGKQDYIISVSRDMEKARYATVYGDESGFIRTDAARDVAQSTIDLMNEVSRDLGIKSRIEETITGLDGREANASMSGDGILSISKTAEKPLVTMVSHESTHRMQQLAPKEYRAFRDFAVQYTGWYEGRLDTGLMTDTATGAKQAAYSQGGTLSSVDYAMDEVTAEFAEKLFSDEQEMADFIREASRTEESRTAVQKFFDIVKDIVKKLKQTVSRLTRNGRTEEAALVQESIDGMEKARALWLDAYSTAKQAATEKALNSNPAVSEMAASMKEQATEVSDINTQFSLRTKEPPKNTITAYKVFVVFKNRPGELYPPMVASPNGSFTPVGVWLDADTGTPARNKDGSLEMTKSTGRLRVQQGGKGTNKSKGGSLAWRPGWHLGEWPDAIQFAVKNPETGERDLMPENFVFAKCEIAADEDYQLEALEYGVSKNGSFNRTQAGLPYIPYDGYYKYRTNADPDTAPWYITGSMRVVEILDDDMARKECAKHGVVPMARRGGDIDLSKYGLKAGKVQATQDLSEYAKIEPQDYSDEVARMPGYVRRALNFDDPTFQKELQIDRVDPEFYRAKYEETHAKQFAETPEIRYGDDKKFSMKDSEGRDLTVVEDTDGNPVAMTYEDGNARFSLKTYEDGGRDYLNKWLDKRVKGKYISRDDADSIVSQMDEYYDICKKFTGKYAPFGAWSKAEVVRDSKGKPVFSVVKANGEYAMNLDFSLVCKKRRTLDAVFSEMINRGILDDADLSEAEISNINSIIRENGFETACALCFVDSKRYRQAKVADSFVDQYNELVKMLLPEDGSVSAHYFDFIGTGNHKNEGAGLHTMSDADLKDGIAKLRQVMKDNGDKTVPYKIAKHLLATKSDRKLLTRSEFMNTTGFEAVKTKNPSVMKLYNSSKGSGGPKAAFSDVQYLGDILKKNAWTPAKAYAVGGVRIQSFSDYIPRLVFDYIQMIGDLSAKQLPAHAYTKEAMFAKQFGMTGIKINLSLVPAIAEDGVAPGLDANGDYYWYDGQSFGSDVNVKGSGNTGFELAKQIQNAPGYSANCGTIAVGVSDEHIRKMLDDPDIRMVIPYHKSSLNHIVSVMNNIDAYKDYTDVQNTRDKKTGSKITGKEFNYNEALRRTGDAKTAAAEYLAWCEENGYLPKFDQFSDNENYYKLLEDFSTYDNGVAVPQGAVTMTFPKKGDAFGSMADLINEGLEEDAILEARRQKSIPGIVDQIEAVLKKKDEGKQFSLKDSTGRSLTKEQAEFFKDSKVRDENGRLIPIDGFYLNLDNKPNNLELTKRQKYAFDLGKHFSEKYGTEQTDYEWNLFFENEPDIAEKAAFFNSEEQRFFNAGVRGDDPEYKLAIRFGDIPNSGRSKNWSTGELERGVSVVDFLNEKTQNGNTVYDVIYGIQGTDKIIVGGWDFGIFGSDGEPLLIAPEFICKSGEINRIKRVTNTNPTSDPDIRYQLKETERLMRENAQLREVVEDLRAQFRTTKFAKVDKKSMDKLTRTLLKDYRSGADINETRDALDSLYTYIANGEDGESPVWSEVFKRAYDAAVSILENVSEVDDDLYTQYKGLRDWLRTQPMSINSMYDHDLIGYDSISDFRKANFGRIKITNDGTPVDMVYSELAATYPGFFDESAHVTQPDQLMHIEEVLNRLQPTEFNPYSANMREAATWLANDIIDRFFELPQAKPTYADKAARKLADQKYRDRQKLDRVRDQKNERIRQLIAQNREKVKQVQVKERTKRDEAVRQVKEHYKAKEAKASERRQAQLLRAKITRHANDLSAKLLKPTDKQHIPENMRTAVAAVLEAINLESQYTYDLETGKRTKGGDGLPTKRTLAFQKLREQYAEIEGAEGNEMVIDPMMQIMIDRVTEMADVKLADMTVSQLNTIWDVLRAVEHSVNTAGRMLVMDKYARTADWASALVEDTATRRGKKSLTKSHVSIDLEDPYTFFSHYGEAGKSVYRMLRDAQDRQQVMTNKVAEEVSKIVTPKQVKAMEKKIHTFKTVRGDDLILSTAQVMELYNLTKREQARDHLNEGGIVQPEIDSAKIRRGTDSILLTDLDLANIIKVLSPEEKTIADKLQGLTVSLLSEYGNEASMKAYGYKKFTEKNYWPIKTAREGRNTGVEKGENNTRSIKNIGMAQSTKPHANNPLDIPGIFTTFSNHTADMVDYAAWLCPMEDANRMYNFQFRDINGNRTGKTVKGMLDKYGGEKAQNYWFNLMEDIQNGIKAPGDTSVGNVIANSIGSFKAAAVGGNLRVVIQQPTAFFRANVVLNPVDLSKGLVSGVTKGNGWEKALKYSPIAMRKDMGGFDISNPMKMSEILFDNRTNIRKLNDALSAPAGKADAVTWGKLWNACEWATAREHKDLTAGSDEFYQTVSELFSEVIDQTQVVDGVLQRSQIMRSSNEVIKQATSFMGEPTKALNILIRSYDAFRYEKEPKARSKAMKVLGRSATALVVTAVVNAAAQSIMDALRDDDDEDWKEKFMQAFTGLEGDEESAWDKAVSVVLNGNVGSNLNPVTQIPFAKDALSIIQGYDVSRTEMEIVTDLIEAGQTFIDSVDGQGKRTRKAALAELFSAASKLYGIPVGNLKRDAWAMLRTFAFETGNIQLQYETDKAIYNLSSTSNKSRFIDILYKAYKEDQDTYEHIYDDLISAGYDADTIKQNMETRMKKDQGVESVSDLEHRYLAPDQQKAYDSKLKELKSNSLWNAASAKDRDTMEDTIFKVVTGDEDTIEAISGGKEYGLDDTEYILYKTAMSMYDQPNANGKYGTYTNKERYDAISAISGLSDFEKAYLWTESSDSTEIYDALGKGINIDVYMEFKGDVDSISADKDSNGKSISGSRKEKIIDYLNAHVGNEKEYWYLLGLEYPSEQKNARYKYFFG